jgi:hypothetical protein
MTEIIKTRAALTIEDGDAILKQKAEEYAAAGPAPKNSGIGNGESSGRCSLSTRSGCTRTPTTSF